MWTSSDSTGRLRELPPPRHTNPSRADRGGLKRNSDSDVLWECWGRIQMPLQQDVIIIPNHILKAVELEGHVHHPVPARRHKLSLQSHARLLREPDDVIQQDSTDTTRHHP